VVEESYSIKRLAARLLLFMPIREARNFAGNAPPQLCRRLSWVRSFLLDGKQASF
jgi:hypothetical protein